MGISDTVTSSLIKIYVNSFDESSAKSFFEKTNEAIDKGQTMLPVYIDSHGGSGDAATSMIDQITSFPGKVVTVCMGKAMSCGCILLGFGSPGYRFAAPNSRIMFHQGAYGQVGKLSDMGNTFNEIKRSQTHIFKALSKNCGQPSTYFLKLIKKHLNTDIFMTPEQAKKHKLIDHIRLPRFVVETTIKII